MAFVIRFDDPQRNPMWLRSEHPAVKWGPLADARRYRTKAAAVSAATKLRVKKRLIVEEAVLRLAPGGRPGRDG
jgi:hypothetical protein